MLFDILSLSQTPQIAAHVQSQIRRAIVTAFVVCYAPTSFISDCVSGGLYSRSGGKSWIKSVIVTSSLFPFMSFGIGVALNTIAMFYGSLAIIPTGTMVVVFVIWACISFPLALLGTVVLEETGVVLCQDHSSSNP